MTIQNSTPTSSKLCECCNVAEMMPELLADANAQPKTDSAGLKATYCSFATKGKFFGGVVFIGSHDAISAAALAWKMGINPGGECLSIVNNISIEQLSVAEKFAGRLLSKDEVESFGEAMEELEG